MKSPEHIQIVHDVLVRIMVGEVQVPNQLVPEGFTKRDFRLDLARRVAVLCWVMDHDHNTQFGDELALLRTALVQMGYQLPPFGTNTGITDTDVDGPTPGDPGGFGQGGMGFGF